MGSVVTVHTVVGSVVSVHTVVGSVVSAHTVVGSVVVVGANSVVDAMADLQIFGVTLDVQAEVSVVGGGVEPGSPLGVSCQLDVFEESPHDAEGLS